ncbi:MAG: hypothetical protein M5U09_01865 [Gammaproteobacteria bacterium]|nr:hypothetical protein [Gammaproteobacteria bacterium]
MRKKSPISPSYIKKVVSSPVIDMFPPKREGGCLLVRHERQKENSEMKADYLSDLAARTAQRQPLMEAVGLLIESRRRVVKLFGYDDREERSPPSMAEQRQDKRICSVEAG